MSGTLNYNLYAEAPPGCALVLPAGAPVIQGALMIVIRVFDRDDDYGLKFGGLSKETV